MIPKTNHKFHRGRSFLKLGKMDLMSPTTKETVEAIYTRRESRSLPVRTPLAVEPSTNSKLANKSSSHNSAYKEIDPDEQITTTTVHTQNEQRNDIHRLFTMLDDLQDEVSSMRRRWDFMAKTGLPDGDLNPRSTAGYEEELDLLADNVSQIGDRINEIDPLKLEVKILKRRIQRLEDGITSTQSSHTVTGLTQDSLQLSKPAGFGGPIPRPPNAINQNVFETGNLNHPQTIIDVVLGPPMNTANSSNMSNDVEITIGSVVSGDGTQKGPLNLRSGAPSLTPNYPLNNLNGTPLAALNPLVSTVPNTQQSTEEKPIESNHASVADHVPPKLPDFLASRSSSTSSRMSSLATESPPRPRTPPTTRFKRQPRSAISLNNHGVIPGSDPEDADYNPRSPRIPKTPPPRGSFRTRGSSRGRRSAPGIHLSAPEWEQEDWAGDKNPASPITTGARNRGVMRRGIGGRPATASEPRHRRISARVEPGEAVSAGERESVGRSSRKRLFDEEGNPLRANGQPDKRFMKRSRDDEGTILTSKGMPDGRSVKRARDENGFLIRANGQRDGRSMVRGKKKRT